MVFCAIAWSFYAVRNSAKFSPVNPSSHAGSYTNNNCCQLTKNTERCFGDVCHMHWRGPRNVSVKNHKCYADQQMCPWPQNCVPAVVLTKWWWSSYHWRYMLWIFAENRTAAEIHRFLETEYSVWNTPSGIKRIMLVQEAVKNYFPGSAYSPCVTIITCVTEA